MPRRKKQKWDCGSLFKVPLSDNSYVIGLVLEIVPELGSFVGAFYNCRFGSDTCFSIHCVDLSNPDVIQFITRNDIEYGLWPVITNVNPNDYLNIANIVNYRKLEQGDFDGVDIIDSGMMTEVYNVLNHLSPYEYADPNEIESLRYNKNSMPLW